MLNELKYSNIGKESKYKLISDADEIKPILKKNVDNDFGCEIELK